MIVLFISLLLNFSLAEDLPSIEEVNHNYCTKLIDSGNYKSAGDQLYCHNYFDMAPAYLIKCLRFENEGYPEVLDRKSCWLYLYDLKDLGPWQDYTVPKDIKNRLEIYRTFTNY